MVFKQFAFLPSVEIRFSKKSFLSIWTLSNFTQFSELITSWFIFRSSESFILFFFLSRMARLIWKWVLLTKFLYDLVILIKYCKIPYKSVDKALLFSRNEVFCLKNWKLWRAPTTLDFNNFCWNFAHVPYLPISTKGFAECFYVLYNLSYLAK